VQSYYRNEGERAAGSEPLICSACSRSIEEEVAVGRRGLLQMTFPDGSHGHLCRICFEGW
jgi:hypothetical protein